MQSGCSLDVRLSNITILYGYGDTRRHAASDVQSFWCDDKNVSVLVVLKDD